MKQYTGKTNTGKAFRGIYTTSGMPNQKQKRVRKSAYQNAGETIATQIMKCNINGAGIAGIILTVGFAPLDIGWKICIAGLFLLSCIHVEVKDNDK